jgi:hypothetical protein
MISSSMCSDYWIDIDNAISKIDNGLAVREVFATRFWLRALLRMAARHSLARHSDTVSPTLR